MKLNQNFLYGVLFIGLFFILIGFDYSNHGSFNWLNNLLKSIIFIGLYILLMGNTFKRSENKKDSHS